MIRLLFLAHRYLGIAVGLVMLLWTLSGIIMMYQPYPELNRWEALALKDPLVLDTCCSGPVSPITRADTLAGAQIEMVAGTPVLRLATSERGLVSHDLAGGRAIGRIDQPAADVIAEAFVRSRYAGETISASQTLHNDQWTVYSSYHPHRPLFKYRISDPAGTEFYLSSRTGELVQLTTAGQRLWGYLGAVIHWLYPTVLRQHTALWAQVVIWLTIIGIFLTVTGVYVGVRQFRQRSNGRLSPYRGLQRYHHYVGLVFGLFTLTWVASGLLSMNPWGVLEGEGAGRENGRLAGGALAWSDLDAVLARLPAADLPPDTVQLAIFPQLGGPAVVAHTAAGDKVRLSATTLAEEPLTPDAVQLLARALRPDDRVGAITRLDQEDAYYYTHHEPRELPVYRVVYHDDQQRLYYLSAVDGSLQLKVDGNLRHYRWLFYALHRGDFSPLARSRPVWDAFMLPLLIGVAFVCASGTWMGWRRLKINRRIRQSRAERTRLPVTP